MEPPVRSEILAHNGAGIMYQPLLRKWAVVDAENRVHAYRADIDAARELAARLPGSPPSPPPEPAPVSRSPAALPAPPATYLPAGLPIDERVDTPQTWESRPMTPYEKSREQCRRQDEAFLRVYGRHLGRRR